MFRILSLYLLFALGSVLTIGGCASPPKGAIEINHLSDMPSIQEKHKDRISKISLGIDKDEFLKVFPEAYVSTQNGDWIAYEFTDTEKYVSHGDMVRQNLIWGFGSPRVRELRRSLWFYFYRNHLLKWGEARDWPKGTENDWTKMYDEYVNNYPAGQ